MHGEQLGSERAAAPVAAMSPPTPHRHDGHGAHRHAEGHSDGHGHHSGVSAPTARIRRPFAPRFSLLRTSLVTRLAGAIGISALIWLGVVWALT